MESKNLINPIEYLMNLHCLRRDNDAKKRRGIAEKMKANIIIKKKTPGLIKMTVAI